MSLLKVRFRVQAREGNFKLSAINQSGNAEGYVDCLLCTGHPPTLGGVLDFKKEVKEEGLVTSHKQLLRERRLLLMKPQ